LLIFKCSN
jgi:hypothetical protein